MTLDERLAGITTVAEFHEVMAECTARMHKIQSECSHSETENVMYSWRPGAFHPSRLCTTCKAPVEGITMEESEEVWNSFYNNTDLGE